MAEKLCSLRKKGGGKMSETVLWTNPSPTSTFAGQTVTLSDNISNYKYIAIEVRWNNSTATSIKYIYDTAELPNCVGGKTSEYPIPYFGIFYNGTTFYYRPCTYVSDTQIAFGNGYYNTASAKPTLNNTAIIPVKIIGLK